jgi:hypothetical protein
VKRIGPKRIKAVKSLKTASKIWEYIDLYYRNEKLYKARLISHVKNVVALDAKMALEHL